MLTRRSAWPRRIRGGSRSEAIRLDPRSYQALIGRAVIRAASPDDKLRDAKKALDDAKKACELLDWSHPAALEAYAAACAESGDFAEAVKWQKKVVGDVVYMKKMGPVASKRLEWYEAKKPCRYEPPAKID
jgi:hypothetical protein